MLSLALTKTITVGTLGGRHGGISRIRSRGCDAASEGLGLYLIPGLKNLDMDLEIG